METYKRLAYWEEIDKESKDWFYEHENKNTNPADADKQQIIADEINDIADDTRVPWVALPDINVPW